MFLFKSIMIYEHCSLDTMCIYLTPKNTNSFPEQIWIGESQWSAFFHFDIISTGVRGGGLFSFCLLLLFPSNLSLVIAFLYHFEIYSLFNSIFIFYDYVSHAHKRVSGNMFWVSFDSNHI